MGAHLQEIGPEVKLTAPGLCCHCTGGRMGTATVSATDRPGCAASSAWACASCCGLDGQERLTSRNSPRCVLAESCKHKSWVPHTSLIAAPSHIAAEFTLPIHRSTLAAKQPVRSARGMVRPRATLQPPRQPEQ